MLGNKILLLGTGGAGKSTLAKEMSKVLGLDVYHLDRYYWKPNWQKPNDEEWMSTLHNLLEKDSWIMDGNYTKTVYERGVHADTALFIDMPRLVALYRIIKRRLQYINRTRPDMREGCNERLNKDFVKWVWTFHTRRDKIISELKRSGTNVVVIKGLRGVKKFKKELGII